ncbi:MAG: acyltransferase [Gemmatimonadaceae bacterium]|nr:acyltransferase [Gemmatimonadaceae bacterium]
MVIAGHFGEIGKAQFGRYARLFDGPLFLFGWTGVDLFFVLSGLLIGGQLWKERKRTGTINVGKFILRRGFRIWPLYLVFVILSPALTGTWSYKWGDWAFLSNYVSGRVEGGWSLSTEEQFYVLAPLTLLAGSRLFKLRGWLMALLSSLAAVAALRWWTARRLLGAGVSVATVKTDMYTPFHLHNEGLIIGLLIALVSVEAPALLTGASTQRGRVWGAALSAMAIAVVLRAANGIVFPFLSLALIYGSIVVVSLALGPGKLLFLRTRPFYTLSRLSYGMYLNHFAVLRWIGPSITRVAKSVGGQSAVSIAVSLAAVIACSALFAVVSFVLVEHPFLAMRGRVLSTNRDARATTSPGLVPVVAGNGYAPVGTRETVTTGAD